MPKGRGNGPVPRGLHRPPGTRALAVSDQAVGTGRALVGAGRALVGAGRALVGAGRALLLMGLGAGTQRAARGQSVGRKALL